MDKGIVISEHAYKRMKERLGVSRKASERLIKKVYDNGIRHSECTGNLFDWITSEARNCKHKGNLLMVYGDKLYIFNSNKNDNCVVLVTLLQIPNSLKSYAEKLYNKKRKKDSIDEQ